MLRELVKNKKYFEILKNEKISFLMFIKVRQLVSLTKNINQYVYRSSIKRCGITGFNISLFGTKIVNLENQHFLMFLKIKGLP